MSFTPTAAAREPTLATPTAENIAPTTARLGATVTSDGNDTITEYGVVWSTSANPTTGSHAGGGISTVSGAPTLRTAFTRDVTGLTAGTTYHYRGYAKNGVDTAYTDDATFSTPTAVGLATTMYDYTGSALTLVGTGGTVGGASVGGAFSYAVQSGGTGSGTISGSALTVTACGTIKVRVTKAADAPYAEQYTDVMVTVNGVAPTLSTPTATGFSANGATLGATLGAIGAPNISTLGVQYGTTTSYGSTANVASPAAGAYTKAVTGLSADTLYHYRGYGVNDASKTGYTADATFRTTASAPGAPTALAITQPGGVNSLHVSWTAASGSAGTMVVMYTSDPTTAPTARTTYTGNAAYGSASTLGSGKIVYVGSGTSVDVTGLSANTRYYVRAYAYKGTANATAALNSLAYSSAATANGYTLAAEPSASPTLSVNSRTDNTIKLNLTRASGAGYTLIVAYQSESAPSYTAPTDGTTYTANLDFTSASSSSLGAGKVVYASTGGASGTTVTVSGLTPGTHYYFAAYAYNGATGRENYRATATTCDGYTFSTEPAAAPEIAITANATGTLTLSITRASGSGYTLIQANAANSFTAPSDGTGYTANARYGSGTRIDSKGYVVYAGSDASTTLEVTGLSAGTRYYFRAYSFNGSGGAANYYTTAYGSANGYTLANPVTVASATADGKTMVRLSWTKPSGAAGVMVVDNGTTAPTQGSTYTVGSTTLGGHVIYRSTGTSLEHVVASGSTHTYKIYAYSSANAYSAVLEKPVTTGSFGAEEIVDTFSYTNGVSLNGLNGEHGWSGAWDTGGTTAPTIVPQSGSGIPVFPNYTEYPDNTGNRIKTSLETANYQTEATRDFTAVSSGAIYAAAIVSYQYEGAKKWAQIGLGNSSGVNIKAGYVWSSTADYHLGIDAYDHKERSGSFEINPYQWGNANNYLVILKYEFSTGKISVKGYYNGSAVPEGEPGSWDVTYTVPSGSRPASLSRFGLLAGATDGGAVGDVYFDEVRVAKSWEALLGGTVAVPENIAELTAAADGKELVRVTALAPANARQIVFIAKSGGTLTTLTAAEQALKSGAPGATAGNAEVIAVLDTTAGSYVSADHVVATGSQHGYFAYAKNSSEYSPSYTAATGNPVETGSYDASEYLDTFSYTNGTTEASSGNSWKGGQGWGANWWHTDAGTWTAVRPTEIASTVNIAGTIANSTAAGNAVKLTNPGEGGAGTLERTTGGDAWGGEYNNTFYVAFRMAYSWNDPNRWAGLKLIDTTDGSKGVFIGRTMKDDSQTSVKHSKLGIEAATSSGGTPSVGSAASGTLYALDDTGGADNAYLVVARVKWTSAGYATVDAWSYKVGGTLPTTEPAGNGMAHWEGAYLANVRVIQLQAGSIGTDQIGDVYFDEVRFGSKWEDLLGGVPPEFVWMDGQTTTAYRGDWVTNAVKSRPVGDRQSAQSLLTGSAAPAASAFDGAGAVAAGYFGKEESDTVTVWHGLHQITSVATTPLYGFGAVSGGGTTIYSMDHSVAANRKHTYNLSVLPKPAAFSAESGGSTKINLSWTPATVGGRTFDEVMVVRFAGSSDAGISEGNLHPEQGRTPQYMVGDTFTYNDHVATVIYRGTGTGFADTRRSPNTHYYYAIYTVNNGYYSEPSGGAAGRLDANATTDAGSSGTMPTVDGDGSDWTGAPATAWNSSSVDEGEFVWNDKKGDLRSNTDDCYSADIDEFRVKADGEWVYFLLRLNGNVPAGKSVDLHKAYVSVGVDTRLDAGSTAMNWLGDESGTELGGAYHGTAAERYASRQMAVHYVGGDENTWQIEMFAEDGAQWYAPPTEGWSAAAAGTTDPCVEWRVARADLGLGAAGTAVTTGRFSVATFVNAQGWNQVTKATVDIDPGKSAAVDAMEIAPYGENDKNADLGAWDEGLKDKTVNFWADVGFDKDGVAVNGLPTEPGYAGGDTGHGSPTLNWTASTDTDAKGVVTGYLFELAEDSATLNGRDGGTENGSVLYRINLKGADNTSYRPQTTAAQFWWRVRARDDSGQLSAGTIRRFGVEGQKDLDGPKPDLLYVGTQVADFLANTIDPETGIGYRDEVEAEGDALAVVDSVYSEGTKPTFGFVLQWTDPSGVYATNKSWDAGYAGTKRYQNRVNQGYTLDGGVTLDGEGRLPGGDVAFTWAVVDEKSTGRIRPFGRVSPNWDLMLVDTTHKSPTRPTLQEEGIDWKWNDTLELPTVDGGKITTSGWTYVYDKDLPFLPSQTLWDTATYGGDANAKVPCLTNFVSKAFKLPAYDPDVSLYLTVSAEDDNDEGDGNRVPDGWMRDEEWHDDDDPNEGNSHANYGGTDSGESSGSCNDGPAYARNVTTNQLIYIPVRDDDSAGPVASTAAWGEDAAWKPSFLPLLAEAPSASSTWATLAESALPRLEGEGQNVTYQLTDAMLGQPLSMLFNVYDQHLSSGLKFGTAEKDSSKGDGTSTLGSRELTNTAFRARSWNATGYAYEAVESPAGSPSGQGWYEKDANGKYVPTEDGSVSGGKTYYARSEAEDAWVTAAENRAGFNQSKSRILREGGASSGHGLGTDASTVLAWDFGTMTEASLSGLFGVPNILDYIGHHSEGATNLVQLHAWDVDNDRTGDQAEAEITFGTLLLTDDDATAPEIPSFTLHGTGTNLVDFGALEAWVWTSASTPTPVRMSGIGGGAVSLHAKEGSTDMTITPSWNTGEKVAYSSGGMKGATRNGPSKYFAFTISGSTSDAGNTRWTVENLTFSSYVTKQGPTRYTLTVENANGRVVPEAEAAPGLQNGYYPLTPNAGTEYRTAAFAGAGLTSMTASFEMAGFDSLSQVTARTLSAEYSTDGGTSWHNLQTWGVGDMAGLASEKAFIPVSVAIPVGSLNSAANNKVRLVVKNGSTAYGFAVKNVSIAGVTSDVGERELCTLTVDKEVDDDGNTFKDSKSDVGMTFPAVTGEGTTTVTFRLYGYRATKDYAEELAAEAEEAAGRTPSLSGTGNWGINNLKLHGIVSAPKKDEVTDQDMRLGAWTNRIEAIDGVPRGYDTTQSGLWVTGSGTDPVPRYTLNYPAGKASGGGQAFAEDTYDIANSRASAARFYDVPNGKFDSATVAWALSGGATVETGTTPSGKWLLLPGNSAQSKATQTCTLSSLPAGMTGVTVQSLLRIRAKETDGENGFTATVELLNSANGVEGTKTISGTANRAWHTFTIDPNPWSLADANVAKVRVTVEQATASGSGLEVDSFETSVAAWGTEGAATGIANGTEGLKLLLKTRIVDSETEIPLSKEIGNSETAAADKLYTIRSTISDWDLDRTDDALPETATASFSLYDDDEVAPQWGSMFGGPMGVMLGGSLIGAGARTDLDREQKWTLSDHAIADASVDSLTLLLNVYDYSGWKTKLLKFAAHTAGGTSIPERVLQSTDAEGTTSVVDSGWTRTESALLENSPSATNAWTISLSDFYSKFGEELRGQGFVNVPVKAVIEDLDNDRADDSVETALEAGEDSVQVGILRMTDQDTKAPKFNTLSYTAKTGYLFSGILLATNLPAGDADAKAVLLAPDNAHAVGGDIAAYRASAGSENPVAGRTHVLWDGELAKVSSGNRFAVVADLVDPMESGRGVGNTGLQRGTAVQAPNKTTRLGSNFEVANTYLTLEVPASSGGEPSHSSAEGAVKWTGAATAPRYAAGLSSTDAETKMATATRLTSWAWTGFGRADIGALLPGANTAGFEDYRLWVKAYDADTDRSGDQMSADLAGPIVRVRDDDTVAPLAPASAVLWKGTGASASRLVPGTGATERDRVPWVNNTSGLSVHFVEAQDGDGREGGAQAHSAGGVYDLVQSGIGHYELAAPGSGALAPGSGSTLTLDSGTITEDDVTKRKASLSVTMAQGYGSYRLFAVDNDDDREGDALAGAEAPLALGYDRTKPTAVALPGHGTGASTEEVDDPTTQMDISWSITDVGPDDPAGDKTNYDAIPDEVFTAAGKTRGNPDILSPWLTYKVYYKEYDPQAVETQAASESKSAAQIILRDYVQAASFGTEAAGWLAVTNGKPIADTASAQKSAYTGLDSFSTSSVRVYDLDFDREYLFVVVGVDKAGNESPVNDYSWATNNTIKFAVTQGLVRTSAKINEAIPASTDTGMTRIDTSATDAPKHGAALYWMAAGQKNGTGTVKKQYDLIFRDAPSFNETGTEQWRMAGNTVKTNWNYQTDGLDRVGGNLRFFRASYAGRWQDAVTNAGKVTRQYPLASEEVYSMNNVVLSEGFNYVSLQGVPYTNTFRGVFGADTDMWPGGISATDTNGAAIVQFFEAGTAEAVGDWYFFSGGNWYGSSGGTPITDDLQEEGFFARPFSINMPAKTTNSSGQVTGWWATHNDYTNATYGLGTNHPVKAMLWHPIMQVPTNAPRASAQTVQKAAGTYNLLSLNLPVAVHPGALGLEAAGMHASANPWEADQLYVIDPQTKEVRHNSMMYPDGSGKWRWVSGRGEVVGAVILPNDMLVILSSGEAAKDWDWSYHPTNFYTLPTRHMGRSAPSGE